MRVETPQLLVLITDTGGLVDSLRADQLPDDAGLLTALEDIYSCLKELQGWRARYPDVKLEPIYVTPFGVQQLQ